MFLGAFAPVGLALGGARWSEWSVLVPYFPPIFSSLFPVLFPARRDNLGSFARVSAIALRVVGDGCSLRECFIYFGIIKLSTPPLPLPLHLSPPILRSEVGTGTVGEDGGVIET